MKNRSTSFVALFCVLALPCSCSSTQFRPASTDGAWKKVAAGHYQSVAVELPERKRKTASSLRGNNPAEKTYGVFVGAIQTVASVGIYGAGIVMLPFVGGGGCGGACGVCR